MKANKMYKQSLIAAKGLPPRHPLPLRLWRALANARFVEKEPGKEPQLKIPELREAIATDAIWAIRNVGQTYVRLLCEYLEQLDHKKAASEAPPEE